MREGSSETTKVVSQAFFGEEIQILQSQNEWVFIQTPDGYRGWVTKESFVFRERPYQGDLEVSRLSAHLYAQPDTEFGPLMTLPFGSKLRQVSEDARWIKIELPNAIAAFIQKGDVEKEPFELISFSKKFLGLPYIWGGRTSFGFDCSGFVQMLYSRIGKRLPRDAREQIQVGNPVAFDQLTLADLIFWGHSEDEICHVGMFLEKDTFIHTSVRENKPYLRLSLLIDEEWNGLGHYSYRTARRLIKKLPS